MYGRYSILAQAQHRRKRRLLAFGAPTLMAMLFNAPDVLGDTYHESIEILGLLLMAVCVAGRAWSSLYIAGRKNGRLVGQGPYSLVRNPLYVASLLGAAGVGLCSGSVVFGMLTAVSSFLVFDGVVRKEEAHLAGLFGDSYRRYMDRVPRWLPALSGWRDADQLTISPAPVFRTILDASLFFLAVPVLESLDLLHAEGLLPVFLHLP